LPSLDELAAAGCFFTCGLAVDDAVDPAVLAAAAGCDDVPVGSAVLFTPPEIPFDSEFVGSATTVSACTSDSDTLFTLADEAGLVCPCVAFAAGIMGWNRGSYRHNGTITAMSATRNTATPMPTWCES